MGSHTVLRVTVLNSEESSSSKRASSSNQEKASRNNFSTFHYGLRAMAAESLSL